MGARVKWGHAPARQLKRVLVASASDIMGLLGCVNDALQPCDAHRAFDTVPHLLIAGTSSVSSSNEKLQVDLGFLSDVIAPHAMDMFPK